MFRNSTVGLPVKVEQLVLPGTELEPAPWDDKSPVVVRVEAVYPHGSALRYDLVYQGLEPGEYDLRNYLRRKDGSTVDDLPPLTVTIQSLLPAGHITPHDPGFVAPPWLGGYRILLAVGAAAWLLVLIWFIFPPRRAVQANETTEVCISLAERLRPSSRERCAANCRRASSPSSSERWSAIGAGSPCAGRRFAGRSAAPIAGR